MYGGHGVQKAVANVGLVIGPALAESKLNVETDQKKIDHLLKNLDGTKNKAKLGANAILGVSMACARAGAAHSVSQDPDPDPDTRRSKLVADICRAFRYTSSFDVSLARKSLF